MTTTYHQGFYAAAPAGNDGFRPAMHNHQPSPLPQMAGPSKTSSALRKGVLVAGAMAAVGAGALLGVALFGEAGSDSTRPVYLVPGTNGNPAVVQAPASGDPSVLAPEGVVVPGVTDVVVLPSDNGPIVNLPPVADRNLAPAPAPNAVQQAPGPVVVPFPVKTDPGPPKQAPPAPPKPAPPKIDPKIEPPKPLPPAPAPIDPKKLDPTIDPPGPADPVGPKLDPTIDPPGPADPVGPKLDPKLDPPSPADPIGPKGPGSKEVLIPKPGP
jgi:hypothetical protein